MMLLLLISISTQIIVQDMQDIFTLVISYNTDYEMVMTRSLYSGTKPMEIIALTQQLISWIWLVLEAKTVLVRTGSTEEVG